MYVLYYLKRNEVVALKYESWRDLTVQPIPDSSEIVLHELDTDSLFKNKGPNSFTLNGWQNTSYRELHPAIKTYILLT